MLCLVLSIIASLDYLVNRKREKAAKTESYINQNLSHHYNTSEIQFIEVQAKKIETHGNTVVYDFGKASFGYLRIDLKKASPSDLSVTLLEFQETHENHYNKLSFGYYKTHLSNARDKISISSPQRHLPLISQLPSGVSGITPFRYAEIKSSVASEEMLVWQVIAQAPFSPDSTTFNSNNQALNEVWDLCRHTVFATTFCGIYVDGERERLPYEADAHLAQLSHMSIDPNPAIPRATLQHLLEHPSWPLEWSFHLISMAYEDHQLFHDKQYIRTIYPELKKRLFLERVCKNGLLSYTDLQGRPNITLNKQLLEPIIDWPRTERAYLQTQKIVFPKKISLISEIAARSVRKKILDLQGFELLSHFQKIKIENLISQKRQIPADNIIIQCYYANALKELSILAKAIDENTDAELFSALENKCRNTINTNYYDSSIGLYRDTPNSKTHSFHSNLFALFFNIAKLEQRKTIVEKIEQESHRASVFTAHFLLETLFANNRAEQAIQYITQTTDRSWLNMIHRHNATMTGEAWNPTVKPNMDWSHAWGSSPAYHIINNIVGIKSSDSTENGLLIAPSPGLLREFSAEVKTPLGIVKVQFEKTNGVEKYAIKLPSSSSTAILLITNRSATSSVLSSNEVSIATIEPDQTISYDISSQESRFALVPVNFPKSQ